MSMNEIYKSNNPFKQFQDWHLGNSYNFIVSKCPTLSTIPYKYNKLYTQYFKNFAKIRLQLYINVYFLVFLIGYFVVLFSSLMLQC